MLEQNISLTVIIGIIYILVSGFVWFAGICYLCSVAKNLLTNIAGIFSRYITLSQATFASVMCGIMIGIVFLLVAAVLDFIIGKLIGSNASFMTFVISCIANSPIQILFMRLAGFLFLASSRLGFILLVLALLSWIVMVVVAVKANLETEPLMVTLSGKSM